MPSESNIAPVLNENIFDMAIEQYGCIEGVMNIIEDNKDAINVFKLMVDLTGKNLSFNVLADYDDTPTLIGPITSIVIQTVIPVLTDSNKSTADYFKAKRLTSWEGIAS